jgi:hypothetical protein
VIIVPFATKKYHEHSGCRFWERLIVFISDIAFSLYLYLISDIWGPPSTPIPQPHKYEAVSIEGIRSSLQRALREMKEMSAERQTTADKMDVELAAADKQVRVLMRVYACCDAFVP